MQPRVDAPAGDTIPGFEGSPAPVPMSSPASQASTLPPPMLPMSDIPVVGTPARQQFFALTVSLEHKKQGHPTDDAADDHMGKRADSGTEEANEVRSSETAPASRHSSDQPASEPLWPPSSPAKNGAVPNDGVAVEASETQEVRIETLLRASMKMILTRMVMSLNQAKSHGRASPTPIWSQQPGTASCSQTQRMQQSGPPIRNSAKRCGPLVELPGGTIGKCPRWCWLAKIIRFCGEGLQHCQGRVGHHSQGRL